MTDYYVSSGGTDNYPTVDGLSWANAFATLDYAIAQLSNGAHRFFLRHASTGGYSDTGIGNITTGAVGTFNVPIEIYACQAGTTAEPPTAADLVTTRDHSDVAIIEATSVSNVSFNFFAYWWGCNIRIGRNLTIANAAHILEQCLYEPGWGNAANYGTALSYSGTLPCRLHLIDCEWKLNQTTHRIQSREGVSEFIMRGGKITSDVGAQTNLFDDNRGIKATFDSVDMTGIGAGAMLDGTHEGINEIDIFNCKITSGLSLIAGTIITDGARARMHGCNAGTANQNPIPDFTEETYEGIVESETATYLTAGPSDGNANLAIKMSPTSGNTIKSIRSLKTPWMHVKADTDGETFTIEVLLDRAAALTDDEMWVEIEHPLGNAGSGGDATYTYYHSKNSPPLIDDTPGTVDPGASPASNEWTISPAMTNAQARQFTYALPTNAPEYTGIARARVCFAPENGQVAFVSAQAVLA